MRAEAQRRSQCIGRRTSQLVEEQARFFTGASAKLSKRSGSSMELTYLMTVAFPAGRIDLADGVGVSPFPLLFAFESFKNK